MRDALSFTNLGNKTKGHYYMNKEDKSNELTIYVGNLDAQVTERILYELMIQVAPVTSVRIPKDRVLKTSQGFGFVQFKTVEDAAYAEKIFNSLMLFGRPIRIRKNVDPTQHLSNGTSTRKVDVGAVLFVKNVDPTLVSKEMLMETFKVFGEIIRPPKLVAGSGQSVGYAFITFADFEASDRAKAEMNGQFLMNNELKIEYALKNGSKTERHGDEAERLLASKARENRL